MLVGADGEEEDFTPAFAIIFSMPLVASVLHGIPFLSNLRMLGSEKESYTMYDHDWRLANSDIT